MASAVRAAPVGRTHGCSDNVYDVKKVLASAEPTHGAALPQPHEASRQVANTSCREVSPETTL